MAISRKRIIFDATSLVPIHIGSNLLRPLGGTEVGVIELAKELSKRGYKVIVKSSLGVIPEVPKELAHFDVQFISINQQLQLTISDVIIVVQGWKNIFPYPKELPVYFWTGDGAEQVSNLGIGDGRFIDGVDALLCASEFHKFSLCSSSGFPEEKAFVIGNGVSSNILSDTAFNSKTGKGDMLNFVYHVAPYRGLVRLLEMFPKLLQINPKFKLFVYSDMELYRRGDSPYEGRHSELISRIREKYKDSAWVQFNPTVPQEKIGEILQDKSFFIYPANVPETFSMATAEAMSQSVIPLVPSIGGLPEVVGDSELVFNASSTAGEFETFCINKITELHKDLKSAKSKAEMLRSRVLNNFMWSNVADKFEKVVLNEK